MMQKCMTNEDKCQQSCAIPIPENGTKTDLELKLNEKIKKNYTKKMEKEREKWKKYTKEK